MQLLPDSGPQAGKRDLVYGFYPKIGWRFIVGTNWDPVAESFGALPFIFGTFASSMLALLIAVPLGIGAAIFLAELAPFWLRSPVGFLIELLAGRIRQEVKNELDAVQAGKSRD